MKLNQSSTEFFRESTHDDEMGLAKQNHKIGAKRQVSLRRQVEFGMVSNEHGYVIDRGSEFRESLGDGIGGGTLIGSEPQIGSGEDLSASTGQEEFLKELRVASLCDDGNDTSGNLRLNASGVRDEERGSVISVEMIVNEVLNLVIAFSEDEERECGIER